MITVYRIENEADRGPYWDTDYGLRPDWMHAHNKSELHPKPSDEFGITPPRNFAYGFESEAQLHKWFGDQCYPWMREKGYTLAKYLVDEYELFTGKRQCAFKRDSAQLIERKLIMDEEEGDLI